MQKIGFDNDKYLKLQSERIKERIQTFGGKLYLEFGGKLFDDYHASRVLPGFMPASKINMLAQLKEQAEVVIVISAADIEKNKVRSDLGITYDLDVLRLIDAFRGYGLYVSSVCLTHFAGQPSAVSYQKRLEALGMKVYRHYPIEGYPYNIPLIVSDDGYGKNEYIETTRSLVVITAPGPGSGKMATCLSQLYHEYKRGIKAGYAKYETFPIWNLPLNHPVNLAYEAATADLNDVNMAGYAICDDEATRAAASQEILRRYYDALCQKRQGKADDTPIATIELLMKKGDITLEDRPVISAAKVKAEATGEPAAAIQLPDERIVTGKTSELLGASSAMLLNALKALAGIDDEIQLISPTIIEPIQRLKVTHLHNKNPRLHTDEILIALSICAVSDENAAKAIEQLQNLKGSEVHSSVILSQVDIKVFRNLGINLTCEPQYQSQRLYHH